MSKVILDLCGGTGSWSLPYKEAGYDVRLITLPDHDVVNWRQYPEVYNTVKENGVYGILAAPPCTMFSNARTVAKNPRDTRDAMKIVGSCLEIVWESQYKVKTGRKITPLKFWALENPYYGILSHFIGEPSFVFDPWEFGHNYKKKTAIWGNFNKPKKKYKDITEVLTKEQREKAKTNSQPLPKFDYMKSENIAPDWFGKLDRKARRAITPRGFAEAFYKANK
jgi:hypothetical protein